VTIWISGLKIDIFEHKRSLAMKPETCKKWEDALSHFGKAEELWKDGKSVEAAKIADMAVWLACIAVTDLSNELKIPFLLQRAKHYVTRWSNKVQKESYTPKQTIEEARGILQRLSDELPADTLRSFG